MVRIAIVGAGYIGQLHAHILHKEFENASVVAIVDKEEKKGRKLASDTGGVYYSDFEMMLKKEDADVVAICTPTRLHANMVLKSAEAGKHIFCEKPLAPTVHDALRMIKAVKRYKITAMAGHVLRFWPVYAKVKEMVSNKELGKPIHCYCERLLTIPAYTQDGWNRDPLLGGVAFDVQIHDLDFMLWLFGKPKKVVSNGVYDESFGGWLHIQSSIDFVNDTTGLVQAGWGFPDQFPFTMGFRVLCEKGTIEWSFRAGQLLEERDLKANLLVYDTNGSTQKVNVDPTDAFILQWQYFLTRIVNNETVDNATFEDGKKALELALATIKSASKGELVRFD
jgi:predicted dehydrogenase